MLAHHPLRQVIGDRRRTDSLLRVPGMRGLVIATLISSLGSSAALLAVAWVSYQHSDSIVHAVIVATAFSIPAGSGPTAGRLPRRMNVGRSSPGATWVTWPCGTASPSSTSSAG